MGEGSIDNGGDDGVEVGGGVADDVDGGFGAGESAGEKAMVGLEGLGEELEEAVFGRRHCSGLAGRMCGEIGIDDVVWSRKYKMRG